jgi:hypothetical protein
MSETVEKLIASGAESIPTALVELALKDLKNENESLRRALTETHAELVRLERVAQY